jgi:hypothetical protein
MYIIKKYDNNIYTYISKIRKADVLNIKLFNLTRFFFLYFFFVISTRT